MLFILQENADTYRVRWPVWVSAIIGLALMAAIVSGATDLLRRHGGIKAMWAGVALATAVMGLFLTIQIRRSSVSQDLLAYVAAAFTVAAALVAPALGVHVGARKAGSKLGRQIAIGALAALLSAAAGMFLVTIAAALRRLVF